MVAVKLSTIIQWWTCYYNLIQDQILIIDLIETSFAMRIEILSISYKAGYNMLKAKNTY